MYKFLDLKITVLLFGRQSNDLECDDMGDWQNNSVRRKIFFVKFDCCNDSATVNPSADSKGHNLYTLKRSYHKNKSSKDVKKIIAILEGKWSLFESIDIEFKMWGSAFSQWKITKVKNGKEKRRKNSKWLIK